MPSVLRVLSLWPRVRAPIAPSRVHLQRVAVRLHPERRLCTPADRPGHALRGRQRAGVLESPRAAADGTPVQNRDHHGPPLEPFLCTSACLRGGWHSSLTGTPPATPGRFHKFDTSAPTR